MNLPYIFPIEIWQIILEKTQFIQQIRLRQACNYFYTRLHIIDFNNIPRKYKLLLNDDILKQHKYIKYLDASINTCGTDGGIYILFNTPIKPITNDGIKHLTSLIELYATNNKYITDVNHLTNLEILDIGGEYCGVGNDGIKNLSNIKELDVSDSRVNKINHLSKMEKLIIRGCCYGGCLGSRGSVGYDDLLGLNLVELDIRCNNLITGIPYMSKLKSVHIDSDCHINHNISNSDIELLKSNGVDVD